jgi:hypothetical protein
MKSIGTHPQVAWEAQVYLGSTSDLSTPQFPTRAGKLPSHILPGTHPQGQSSEFDSHALYFVQPCYECVVSCTIGTWKATSMRVTRGIFGGLRFRRQLQSIHLQRRTLLTESYARGPLAVSLSAEYSARFLTK